MNHFINSNVVELSLARSVSLINPTTPKPFPVLGYGDGVTHQFFFHNDGSIESWSGDATNGLRVTLGDVNLGPAGGTYTLTCNQTTLPILYAATADQIQTALNGLAQVLTEGFVDVSGSFPNFLVTWRTTGVKTALTATATNLVPDSGIAITQLTAGDATHTQRDALTLRQNAIYSTTSWTPITSPYNGWTGTLSTNTAAALAMLLAMGEQFGDYTQLTTIITVERIQPNGSYQTMYQSAVIIRAKNADLGSTGSTAFSTYLTVTQFRDEGVQNRSDIVGLASAIADITKLGGLDTAAAVLPEGCVMVLNFSVTINDGGGTHTGLMTLVYQLLASTHATAWPLWGRPYDYNASTNAAVWRLVGAFLDTLPASYNADTGKFHYIGAAGAAGSVYIYADQTGTAAPA